MSNAMQWLVLGPFLVWSVWRVLGKVLPRSRQKLQWALVTWLGRVGLPGLARRVQPSPLSTEPCGTGCGGCDTGCEVPKPPAAHEQPVRWR